MSLKTIFGIYPRFIRTIKHKKIYNLQATLLNVKDVPQQNITLYSTAEKAQEEPPVKQIYYGILTPQIKAVKFFSLSSSFIGISAQPFLYNAIMSFNNTPVIVAAYSFVGFFTFVTPFLLHFITKKYVTLLEYNQSKDSYIASTVNFFLITKKLEFKVEDVRVPEITGMFTTLIAAGKPLFMEPRLFENPHHYGRLMGYDKPIDFKMYQSEASQCEEKK